MQSIVGTKESRVDYSALPAQGSVLLPSKKTEEASAACSFHAKGQPGINAFFGIGSRFPSILIDSIRSMRRPRVYQSTTRSLTIVTGSRNPGTQVWSTSISPFSQIPPVLISCKLRKPSANSQNLGFSLGLPKRGPTSLTPPLDSRPPITLSITISLSSLTAKLPSIPAPNASALRALDKARPVGKVAVHRRGRGIPNLKQAGALASAHTSTLGRRSEECAEAELPRPLA